MPIGAWSTAASPRPSTSACDMIATSPIPARLTMKKPALGSGNSNDHVRSSTASLRTQDSAPRPGSGGPAGGVIARLAALVVFGETALAVEGEHHVVGGEDRAVVERRPNNRRPDRNGVDPLRRGELWDRRAIAGIHRHGRVEDGAVRVEVRDAAGTMLIQAPLVAGGHADDRGVQIDLVERPGHGVLGRAGLVGPDDGGRGGGVQTRVSASGSATMQAMKPARLVRSRPMRCAAPWMART